MDRAELKARAKAQLGNGIFQNTWLMAALVCFIQGAIVSVASSLLNVAGIVLAGPMAYGLSVVFLKNAREGGEIKIEDLFAGFSGDFLQIFLMGLLQSLFIALGSVLFVIPGIIVSMALSMVWYIKIDHPSYTWKEAFAASRDMTNGRKMELFILSLSFIGWMILGSLCFGIGILFVMPYMNATMVQWYLANKPAEVVL